MSDSLLQLTHEGGFDWGGEIFCFLISPGKEYLYRPVLSVVLVVFYGIHTSLHVPIPPSPVRRKAGERKTTRSIRGRVAFFLFGSGQGLECAQ